MQIEKKEKIPRINKLQTGEINIILRDNGKSTTHVAAKSIIDIDKTGKIIGLEFINLKYLAGSMVSPKEITPTPIAFVPCRLLGRYPHQPYPRQCRKCLRRVRTIHRCHSHFLVALVPFIFLLPRPHKQRLAWGGAVVIIIVAIILSPVGA